VIVEICTVLQKLNNIHGVYGFSALLGNFGYFSPSGIVRDSSGNEPQRLSRKPAQNW
jgi:hypothetical protein